MIFFFQAEDGIRDYKVTGVQTCALPISAWPHVQLHAVTYERLELTDQAGPVGEGDARAAQLWVGLARAALATAPEDTRPTPTEPAVIAQAIDQHSKAEATGYDQVIVGYLLQIAAELKTAGSAEAAALRRRTSRLIRTLKPETLRELKAWDWGQRLALAGIQRLEFSDPVSREEFEGFLDEVLARLTLSTIDTTEARQMRRSSIRFGAVGVRGGDEQVSSAIPTATINYSLSEEADTIRWVQQEVQARGALPFTEAEAVGRSLAIAMHGR